MKFPKLVIEEATALKKHATKEEIDRLDFSKLKPDSRIACIYGQMTGNCYSVRSKELIERCTKRVYHHGTKWDLMAGAKLNGSPLNVSRMSYFSPIEIFIVRNPNQSGAGKLIQFLKGEIETLN